MSCECGHPDDVHELLKYASGLDKIRCKGLGIERRPMAPGSKVMGLHFNCPCTKILKTYVVKAMDTRTKEKFWMGEYKTREEAEKKKDELDEGCDDMWCEHHRHWIEVFP